MADILPFPTERAVAAVRRAVVLQPRADAKLVDAGADAWFADDAADPDTLETVAGLAAVPSPSLAVLAAKMEVLVGRLAPDDGTDAGLCIAEASLLRSMLRDLQAFARDTVFAA